MPTDASLLQRYLEGDEKAFAELVTRYLNGVYSWALRRMGGDVHLAQDVAQQVFIALARDARRLSTHPVLTGWLYVATRNAAANEVRRERRRKAHEQEVKIMHDILAKASPGIDWNAVAPVLEEAIDRLGETDRVAILLRFSDRRTFAEIGGVMRLTEEAARKRVDRAVDKLRELIAGRGIATSSAAFALALTNNAVVAAPAGFAASVAGASVAGAAAAAPSALSFLSFMGTTKTVPVVAAIILALAIGSSGYEASALRQDEKILRKLNRDYDELLAKWRDLDRRSQAAVNDVEALNQAVQDERAAEEAGRARLAAQAEAAKKAAAWDPVEQGKIFMTRHPEVKQALLEWTDARLNLRYRALYKDLGLSPPQIERFQALMRENWAKFGPPLGANGEVLSLDASTGMTASQIVEGVRELLGEEGFRKYMEFDRAASAQIFTEKIASVLCFTDAPLTAGQADELLKIIASSQVTRNAAKPRRFDWDTVTAKSQAVLSPSQLTALAGMRAEDEFQQAFNGFRASHSTPASTPGGAGAK